MTKRLQFIDGSSDKFWQIETSGLSFTVVYGRNGTSGQSQTKTFDSEAKCLAEAEKLVAEKTKKGYSENGEVLITATANPKAKTAKQSDEQEVLAEYTELVKTANLAGLLPFLQNRSKGHTEALKKHIRKAKTYWMSYVDLSKEPGYVPKKNGYHYGTRGSAEQQQVIVLSAIALFNKTEITPWDEAIDYFDQLKAPHVLEILEWAKPNWIDTFLLEKMARNEWRQVNYRNLRLLEDKGLIEYNPELFARMIAQFQSWDRFGQGQREPTHYVEFLVTDPIALERDIPQLFNYETNLQNQAWQDPETKKWNGILLWDKVFTRLLEEQKIERRWLLENSLLLQTKEWNANLKSFFRKRIDALAPTNDELLQLQDTIFPLLHSTLSAVANYGIELCKQIADEKTFNSTAFLEWAEPIMMRTDCKGGIKTLLNLFAKMVKSQPKLQQTASHLAADVFVVADLGLQERAAKTIEKLGDKKDPVLKDKLAMYQPQMQGNISQLLAGFLDSDSAATATETQEAYRFSPQKTSVLLDGNRIALPQDWNGILFQFGKFISSTEVLDTEILLNTYITQQALFPADAKAQLQPYFKQLLKAYFEANYKNVVKGFLMSKIENPDNFYKTKESHYLQSHVVKQMEFLITKVQLKINAGSTLPLLSFPTHAPHWVAPLTLVQRLLAYQQSGEAIDMADFAIAISRMPRENVAEALVLCPQLDPIVAKLLQFCLGASSEIVISETSFFTRLLSNEGQSTKATINNAYWALAARTFQPLDTFPQFEKTIVGKFPFVIAPFEPKLGMKERWNEWKNYQTKATERSPSWYEMSFSLPSFEYKPPILLYSLDVYSRGKDRWHYSFLSAGDALYWHSMMPQNDEALAVAILASACSIADESGNDLTGFLYTMMSPEFWFGQNSLMVLACSLFKQKKETRSLVAEVLIHHIQQQSLDIVTLGQKTAWLMSESYGPIQRFLDIVGTIKDVSSLHNSALASLFDSLFSHWLPKEKLPVNFKKMLETYFDLLTKTGGRSSQAALATISQWKDHTALKAIVKQINSL